MDSKTCYSLYNDSNVQESSIFISIDNQEAVNNAEEEQFLNAVDNTENEEYSNENVSEQLEYDQDTGEYMFQEPILNYSNNNGNVNVTYSNTNQDGNTKIYENENTNQDGNTNIYGNRYGNEDPFSDNQQFQDMRNDLEDTTNTLRDNIHRVEARQFKIEHIDEETNKLLDSSNKFRQRSNELRKKMLTKYLVHIFCMSSVVVFIIILIIILIRR